MKSSNRKLYVLLIILLSVIAVLLLGIMIFLVSSHGNFVLPSTKTSSSVFDESYEVKDINAISIDSDVGNIEFNKSDDDSIRLIISSSYPEKISVNNINSQLIIKNKNSNDNLSFLGKKNLECSIKFYLPDKTFDSIDISSDYGEINADTLTAQNLDFELDYGDFTAKKISAQTFNAELDYGDFEINSFEGGFNVESDCGNIEISKAVLTSPSTIESSMGNIDISNIQNVNISGEVSLGNCNINGSDSDSPVSLKAISDMGNININ